MKRLLLIVLPLLLIVGCSKPINESSLVDRSGVKYQQDSEKPYSGKVFRLYDTGEKLYQGTYENGLLIDYSYLNEDGSVKEPINYETTLVRRKGVYYNKDTNKPYSGPVFSLNDEGLKKKEGLLVDGKMITYTDFDWYDNGQKAVEVSFKDGKQDGLRDVWYPNGQKVEEGTFKDGKQDGLFTKWHKNGQKKYEGTFKDGKKDGSWTRWYESGEKWQEETFKDGEYDGLYTGWYRNGQKFWERTYKFGKEISSKEWNEDGIVKY